MYFTVFVCRACILGIDQLATMFWFIPFSLDFYALTSAFQFFIHKLCLQMLWVRMHNVLWNWLPI